MSSKLPYVCGFNGSCTIASKQIDICTIIELIDSVRSFDHLSVLFRSHILVSDTRIYYPPCPLLLILVVVTPVVRVI
jgi:hypothetical protein